MDTIEFMERLDHLIQNVTIYEPYCIAELVYVKYKHKYMVTSDYHDEWSNKLHPEINSSVVFEELKTDIQSVCRIVLESLDNYEAQMVENEKWLMSANRLRNDTNWMIHNRDYSRTTFLFELRDLFFKDYLYGGGWFRF